MNGPAPAGEAGLSGIPNTAPLDLFPQVHFGLGSLSLLLKHVLTN